MFTSSLRASRQSLARATRQSNTAALRRTFVAPTATRQADMVQDMYLRELKAYKAPPVKAGDAEQHVQKFKMPAAPKSPEEADMASELKAYEDQAVEVEGASTGGQEGAAVEKDWFEEPEEEEDVKH
ncbi:hypothetical protein MBLNU230_g2034t1 [Neophaeotheca triangularis]